MILTPIILSLKIASIATIFTLIWGVLLAQIFTKYEFKGKSFLEVIVILPIVLPPSITGYALLILIGRNGLIGEYLYNYFGITLVFTWEAACLAATIVSLPLMYQSCKAAFLNVNHTLENAARTLGSSETRIFWEITLPLAWPGVVSGTVLSYARALGEFGATLMVAGDIPGKTETIPIAMYFAVESGDTKTANILLIIVVVSSFILIFSLNYWLKSKQYK